ncbi:hypothetical protein QN277_010620 [Acacia crassicarpa]|uniref:Disease resistance R13L4/SHOC-2-like LRR domain-containing protein n=1 Tax=Acacia crassicarpa TaxID=499986 RepID=A0AAE1M4V8_9FABA|nr:hypothetical protein QN277_010620 [Acacia crassicarpa]
MSDVRTLLNRLKKTFEEIFEDVSSAKDVKKIIDHLLNQFPRSQQWEQELRSQLDCDYEFKSSKFRSIPNELDQIKQSLALLAAKEVKSSEFRSIRHELDQIKGSLARLAAEADQDDFKALSVMEQDIIDKEEPNEHPLVKCLRVSYEFFHRKLQHDKKICLLLAIFPEHAILRKRFLIYWWIGEGLVEDEAKGEEAIEQLLDLELLIPYRTDKSPRVSKFQIFPWVRYMLISEAKKEKLLRLQGGIPLFDPHANYFRRFCLIDGKIESASQSESMETLRTIINVNERDLDLETLRTIINVNERDLDFQHQSLAKLKDLVVLQLGRWQVSPIHHIEVRDESFLTGLKTQKLLKYLSLRGISRITALPESIKELVSLEILDLKACHNLETLPDGIASLRNLTHLDVSECYLLDSMPKGLDKLTSLQVLKGFIIGSSLKTPIRIKHLQKSLVKLKRLSIHIGSEASIQQEEEFDKLKDFEKLECLKISWGKAVKEYSLSLPSKLKKLDLEGIPHENMPEWLSPSKLGNLETLCIKGGKLKDLLVEGEPWNNVKYLVLKYTNMKVKEETCKSVFPSLQYVKKVEWVKKGEEDDVEYEWNRR